VVGVNLQSKKGEKEREREREEGGAQRFGAFLFRFTGFSIVPPTEIAAWLQKKKKEVVPISIGSDQRRRTHWGAF
jgi:hypothetical protein